MLTKKKKKTKAEGLILKEKQRTEELIVNLKARVFDIQTDQGVLNAKAKPFMEEHNRLEQSKIPLIKQIITLTNDLKEKEKK